MHAVDLSEEAFEIYKKRAEHLEVAKGLAKDVSSMDHAKKYPMHCQFTM